MKLREVCFLAQQIHSAVQQSTSPSSCPVRPALTYRPCAVLGLHALRQAHVTVENVCNANRVNKRYCTALCIGDRSTGVMEKNIYISNKDLSCVAEQVARELTGVAFDPKDMLFVVEHQGQIVSTTSHVEI